ncbi:zinc finger protein ush-like [Watersipora subatra]|uniref:zinc finger protein ush-like n=1 Tax=Watersipora subatra TaxID=2589382 RepID=UPI00355C5F1F
MMSRRKQQNPKPLKFDESPSLALSKLPESGNGATEEDAKSSPPSPEYMVDSQALHSLEKCAVVKDEPASPKPESSQDVPWVEPDTTHSVSLENLLGVPDDAPLRVQKCANGSYKILSAKHIAQGAGLDPLKAQRISSSEEGWRLTDNIQLVSFQQKHPRSTVYFKLESAINCSWLKCLGVPSDEAEANVNIYYAGNQLWVEVAQDLLEGQELIAEFQEHDKRRPVSPKEEPNVGSSSPRLGSKVEAHTMEAQFPCLLCGVQFRNPNTLMAHQKHYCSKLASPTSAAGAKAEQESVPAGSESEAKDLAENLQQTAFICLVCKFMSVTESDMKTHVSEKHKGKQQTDSSFSSYAGSANNGDKTYCDDCEIHFKKPESYQAHKQHYCKNRASSNSPRSETGGNLSVSQSSSPLSPLAKESYYKKVSVVDNQALSASFATQAAAAMAAASLPFTLSSMLSLPGMSALPMMPALKMLQSPALFAQAMQSAVKGTTAAVSSTPTGTVQREETPLDLTLKSDLPSSDTSVTLPAKRRASREPDDSHLKKHRISGSSPPSPVPSMSTTVPALSQVVSVPVKPLKPERPVYRCESCSIPFYKKEVYEAHRLHYCSRRPGSGGSDKEEDASHSTKLAHKTEQLSPPVAPADDRLVITYTCNKCSTSYRTIETFKAHQCALPVAPLPLLCCDDCSFTTQSSRSLAEHAETHQKVNLMYKCKLCGYHGNTLRGMRQHGRQHMQKGEEFNDNDVEAMELPTPKASVVSTTLPLAVALPYSTDVDELLRLKNEPYKKRRSKKHYQKSEYVGVTISPQRKENGLQHGSSRSSSPHSTSTVSCISPLQLSTQNILPADKKTEVSPTSIMVKREPIERKTPELKGPVLQAAEQRQAITEKPVAPVKRFICSCNTSFASVSTFEAHKKLYCPHHKAQRNPTITVNH